MILANAPQQIVEAWATGDATKTNPIPVPSQIGTTHGAASYTDGFPPLCATPIASGGIPPSKADMNGILFQMSGVDVWACAGGGFLYNSAFSAAIGGYPKGARVLMASGNGYWVSTVDNNVSDPDTGGSGWASADENAITQLTGDVTAVGPGSAAATLAASGVTAGSYAAANITVDAKGRVTAATSGGISMSGNLAGSSRVFATSYTAASDLLVTISAFATTEGTLVVTVSGLAIPVIETAAEGERGDATLTFAVPAGVVYSAVGSNGTGATLTLSTWIEWVLG